MHFAPVSTPENTSTAHNTIGILFHTFLRTMRRTFKEPTVFLISLIAVFIQILTICRISNNIASHCYGVNGYSILFLAAARRGQGKLQRTLTDDEDGKNTKNRTKSAAINQGRGQLVTGVTLPTEVIFRIPIVLLGNCCCNRLC